MSLRIISGRSGQGKTRYIMDEVIRLSAKHPEKKYYVVVPEQFSLEMQTKLMERHPDHGFFNIEVLSFYRLAYCVFDECNYQPKDILEDLGVSLLLKKIMTEHEEEFPFFKKSVRQAGFIDELKSMLMEFINYDVSWEELQGLDDSLRDHPGLQSKCAELARIYEYFDREIADRYMVAEQILDVLCELVPSSSMLREGVFYLDGFTGFTPVQLHFLRELLQVAARVNISITMEGHPFAGAEGSEFSERGADSSARETAEKHHQRKEGEELFFFSRKTVHSLVETCQEAGVEMETPLCLWAEETPRFTNAELAFLEKNMFRLQRGSFDGLVEHIHVTTCPNIDQEVDYVLHKIEHMVRIREYRYRDVAVLTGNVEEYASTFRRKADILHVPLFVDTKKRVAYHSGVETLRALMHLAVMDYSYESVFRYLKSGMSDFTDEETDYLENYVIWAGIQGHGMWKQPFVRRMSQISEETADMLQDMRRRFLEETEECVAVLQNKNCNVREKMTALYEEMCRLHYDQKLNVLADQAEAAGDYVREKECRQLFSLLLRLLDKIVGIFGEERMPLDELAQVLDAGLDALELGTPPLSMDQLVLGDLKRTRLPEIKVLFIVGMNDGKIPPALEDKGILHDEEKQILEQLGITLSLPLLEQSMEDEFYMYLAFAKPAEELYFVYPQQDGSGGGLLPSPLFKTCMQLFPNLSVRSYPQEEKRYYFNLDDSKELLVDGLRRLEDNHGMLVDGLSSLENSKDSMVDGRCNLEAVHTGTTAFRMLLCYWYDKEELNPLLEEMWEQKEGRPRQERLPEELVRELFGNELKGSVTRLERYASCPYQYYCIYGLQLQEREEYKVRPMDLGNLFHEALERFSKRVKESEYTWKTLPESVADAWIAEEVKAAATAEKTEVLYGSARNQYKIQVVDRILKRTVQIVQMQLADSHMEPDQFELHFGKTDPLKAVHIPLENGNQMVLEGLIDRVDICEEKDRVYLRIIDYKSGIQTFDMSDLFYGLQMQLVVYMDVASEMYAKEKGKEVVPTGMYYYSLKDPLIKAENAKKEQRQKEFRMSGYANSDPEALSRLEDHDGDFVSASIRMTKKGTPYKNSPVMDTEDFQRIHRYMRRKMKEMGDGIYAGDIGVRPYKKDNRMACDYCPYQAVCGFDVHGKDAYRNLKKKSAEEVLEEIRCEMDES